jgi:anhydro-N-acetylmuramic acid kinase
LAERCGIDVICDFRSRDLAAGGQGAPLVPAFHAAVFAGKQDHRVVVNIGGIANITDLPINGLVRGFDCGPGNVLLDLWALKHLGKPCDFDGQWGSTGTVLSSLLARLLSDTYFSLKPPKSTGREYFNAQWLSQHLTGDEAPQDVQATLAHLTVETIAQSVEAHCVGAKEVYVCGGGAHNAFLMQTLSQRLAQTKVSDTSAVGIDPDWVEAAAFAWLAEQWMLRAPGNLPEVTGALGSRVLGACYPA